MAEKSRFAYSRKIVWEYLNSQDKDATLQMGEDYKRYIKQAKTERETINLTREFAENNGYEPIDKLPGPLKPGDRVYQEIKGKALVIAVIGERPLVEGVNIIGAHVDSPRFDYFFIHLFFSEMRQYICNCKNWIVIIFTKTNVYLYTIISYNHPV